MKMFFLFQILSCAHCLDKASEVEIYFTDGTKIKVNGDNVNCKDDFNQDSFVNDICLIKLNNAVTITPLSVGCRNTANYDRRFAIGLAKEEFHNKYFYEHILRANADISAYSENCDSKPNIHCVSLYDGPGQTADVVVTTTSDSGKILSD